MHSSRNTKSQALSLRADIYTWNVPNCKSEKCKCHIVSHKSQTRDALERAVIGLLRSLFWTQTLWLKSKLCVFVSKPSVFLFISLTCVWFIWIALFYCLFYVSVLQHLLCFLILFIYLHRSVVVIMLFPSSSSHFLFCFPPHGVTPLLSSPLLSALSPTHLSTLVSPSSIHHRLPET